MVQLNESVMITAQRQGQVEAINQQLTANTIMNVVSSDRIKELPDANAAESIGRVSGVSIRRNAGEGQQVIRCLGIVRAKRARAPSTSQKPFCDPPRGFCPAQTAL